VIGKGSSEVAKKFFGRSVRDQLTSINQYPIVTRPYMSGLGRKQVELGRQWSGNFDDPVGRADLIGSGNVA